MSNAKGWPGAGAFPFMPFPIPGFASPASPEAPPAASSPLQPAAAAVANGMEMLTNLWSHLPGSSQVPGFLVPTVDLDELDKRLADLHAAESWVEVNLNMLRATIRGLEVQRHTIAALHSLSAVPSDAPAPRAAPAPVPAPQPVAAPEPAPPEPPAAAVAATIPGVASGDWLAYMQDQFAKVAQAALKASTPAKAAPSTAKTAKKKAAKPRARRPAGSA